MWPMSLYKEKNDTRYIAVTLRCLYLYLVDHYLIFVILGELCNKYQKKNINGFNILSLNSSISQNLLKLF